MTKNNGRQQEKTFYDGFEMAREKAARDREENETKRCGVKTYRKKRDVPD